ncbi:hypothetical protein D3C72_185890 [compost metagenome]
MKSTIEAISEAEVLKMTIPTIPPTTALPGDIWIDTGALPGSVLMKVTNGGTGAHSHSITSSNIKWTTIANLEPTYSFQVADSRVSMTEKEITSLITEARELKHLCEEQPAVKEALERLQTLVKLYRE